MSRMRKTASRRRLKIDRMTEWRWKKDTDRAGGEVEIEGAVGVRTGNHGDRRKMAGGLSGCLGADKSILFVLKSWWCMMSRYGLVR